MKDQLDKYTAWLKHHDKYTAKQVLEQVVADIKNATHTTPVTEYEQERRRGRKQGRR